MFVNKTIIVSVGGSIIVPSEIDVSFLKYFKSFIDSQIKKGFRFVIVCGGGKTSRNYQTALRNISKTSAKDLDWLGISATILNAQLVRAIFSNNADALISTDPNKAKLTKKILVASGWRPGRSSDFVAVTLAKKLKARRVVNLSNIDYVHDKDPNKFKGATPIENISWRNFRNIIPKTWDPGLSSPFDPVASKMAEANKIEVAIINGRNLKEFGNYLAGRKFVGTKIS